MSNIFSAAKQAMEMRSQMKKMQKVLEAEQSEYANGGVKVVTHGGIGIVSIAIEPEIVDITDLKKLERTITENANKSLGISKEKAAKFMQEKSKELGLDKLLAGGL